MDGAGAWSVIHTRFLRTAIIDFGFVPTHAPRNRMVLPNSASPSASAWCAADGAALYGETAGGDPYSVSASRGHGWSAPRRTARPRCW